ncbi:MAG: hypothetical protein Q7R95_01470 [bacterium]|nr:hypothetical protein [bacterium]
MDKRKFYIRIIFTIFLSFGISFVLLKTVFVSNSPSLYPSTFYANNIRNVIGVISHQQSVSLQTKDVLWESYAYTANSSSITIKVPKGESPPTQEILDALLN